MNESEINLAAAKAEAHTQGILSGTILLGTVGSTVHGTNVEDGVEDLDLMGVCIESERRVLGFQEFEQFIYRSAAKREGKDNARSRAGDVDMVIYSLRKYLRLALKGNPTILTLLFTKKNLISSIEGISLQGLASKLVSKKAGAAYLGYMQAQRQRLLGERGGRHGSRPELTNQFGYDSKYAAHVLRLGYQGIELMETGRLTLPMPEVQRRDVLAIRRGEITFDTCMSQLGSIERELKDSIETSSLRAEPDRESVEKWMIWIYKEEWFHREAEQRIL